MNLNLVSVHKRKDYWLTSYLMKKKERGIFRI